METNVYLKQIINKYALIGGLTPAAATAAQSVFGIIQTWANQYLLKVSYSGSIAKGTAIAGIADMDLFISLSPEAPGTLAELYTSLGNYRGLTPYGPKHQNVSIGITYSGYRMDLVPGRKQSGNTSDHSIYRSKARTWTQTNIDKHISTVQNSGRLDEIRALKIWRSLHGLDFPSFYLEMTVINALQGKRTHTLASNFVTILEYLRDTFTTASVLDPANSNNKLSDDLTRGEKSIIRQKAAGHLKASWNQILW